jgi:hypothetical protein
MSENSMRELLRSNAFPYRMKGGGYPAQALSYFYTGGLLKVY